jgi:ubiquinone/menaquinone biosynthesis C-methylase UbiE
MVKKNDFNKKFKIAVERNFDQSAGIYDSFEEKHRLFETLTRKLCELNAPFEPKKVLDVGCGTGISTLCIHKSLKMPPIIYAIDISEAMLIKARERLKGTQGIYFVRGDAEKLSQYFHEAFDAVFYTASIFLLPNFKESIDQACKLILPGGVLAISYYDGLFNAKGRNAVSLAFPELKYQYGTVSYDELMKCIEAKRGFKTSQFDYRFEITDEFLFDFLSIPAQSAGIYPKAPYIERIPMVRETCDKLTKKVSPLFMGWKFVVSRKG